MTKHCIPFSDAKRAILDYGMSFKEVRDPPTRWLLFEEFKAEIQNVIKDVGDAINLLERAPESRESLPS